jgi:hypothetical protein
MNNKKGCNLKFIGASWFFHMPIEYIKVYSIQNNVYLLSVEKMGDRIVFTKIGEKNEPINEKDKKNEKEITNNINELKAYENEQIEIINETQSELDNESDEDLVSAVC